MAYNHPTSLNKSKAGPLIALIITIVALSGYLLFSSTGKNPAPTIQTPPDNTNMQRSHEQTGEGADASLQQFSLPPFNNLDAETKNLLLSENHSEGTRYELTQNTERAWSTICYGDFDADGQEDVAIVMDNNEKQSSRLLIICTHTNTRKKYLAFSQSYSDKIKISAFRKGAKITMQHESPEPSAIDGIIANGEDVKLAVVYDTRLQKFNTFYQE